MQRLLDFRVPIILVLGIFAITGCGKTVLTGTGADVSATATSSSYPTSTPAVTTTPQGTPTMSGTISAGNVSLTASATQFARGDTMMITVSNGLSTTLMVADHQSLCSIFKLEFSSADGTWQTVAPCRLMTPTRLIEIPPNSQLQQQLVLNNASIVAGTYRVQLSTATVSSNVIEFTVS